MGFNKKGFVNPELTIHVRLKFFQNDSARLKCLLPPQILGPVFEPEAAATGFDGSSLETVSCFFCLHVRFASM